MFGPHDGRRVEVHPYRRMMTFLMRGRNESAVYFEHELDLARAQPWLAERGLRLFPLILHALAATLHERERLNRFTLGHDIYQRTSVQLSFAAKKQLRAGPTSTSPAWLGEAAVPDGTAVLSTSPAWPGEAAVPDGTAVLATSPAWLGEAAVPHGTAVLATADAPLAMVKRRFSPTESLADVQAALERDITDAKSERRSHIDKELRILLALPAFLLRFLIALNKRLYRWGIGPRSLVDTDPLYASAVVANLGSIQLDAAYHHLYEHGNCPLFVTVGKVRGDKLTIRYTFDERIEDGYYAARSLDLLKQKIEDPASWL